jgi:hypothetical protein
MIVIMMTGMAAAVEVVEGAEVGVEVVTEVGVEGAEAVRMKDLTGNP